MGRRARVRIGVAGGASIAVRRILPAMARHPDVEIAAVASRDPAKAEGIAAQFGCRAVTGYSSLLTDDGVDALYLPLPAALHGEWAERALRAGKHVLGEKPLTTDPAHTRRVLALAASRRLTVFENVMFVHHSRHATVRELVAGGAIGRLRAFRSCFSIPGLPDGDIRYRADLGGGSLFDVGLYPVRAALHFLGTGLTVTGAVLSTGDRAVDISGAVLLEAPGGVVAQLSFGMEHHYQSGYELLGSSGRICVDRAFTPPADLPTEIVLETSGGVRRIPCAPDDQAANTLTAFAAAVAKGSGADAACLDQADLLEAVRRAAAPVSPPA